MDIHGLTRGKEIYQLICDTRVGISYDDVLKLYDTWASDDAIEDSICPAEICEGKPGTIIIDDDNFHDRDVNGDNTTHRTNIVEKEMNKKIRSRRAKV